MARLEKAYCSGRLTKDKINKRGYNKFLEISNDGYLLSIETPTDALPGDANGDGVINAKDVLAIVNKILGKPDADFNETAADVNGDGVVNIADVIGVKNIIK